MGGDEVREILAYWYNPDGDDVRTSPRRSDQSSTNLELLPERARLARGGIPASSDVEQRVAQHLPSLEREPESEKEHRFESTDRMRRGQQVVANLRVGNSHASGVRQQHDFLYVTSDDAAKSGPGAVLQVRRILLNTE